MKTKKTLAISLTILWAFYGAYLFWFRLGIDISSPSSEKMFITVFLIFGGLFYFLACAAGKEYKQLGVKIWGVATTIGLEAMLFLEKYEVAIPEVLRLNLVTEVIVWIFLGIISVILWNLGNSKK